MHTIVNPDAIKFYQQLLKRNGIEGTIEEVRLRPAHELHGEHFASTCDYISIRLDNGQALELFAKNATKNPGHLALIKKMNAFPKEAGFFNSVAKDMREFFAKRTKTENDDLDFLPKCYFADDKQIIFENLAKKGFVLLCKVERMNVETAKLVLNNMAQFHAISYAMSQEIGEEELLRKYPCLEEAVFSENGSGREDYGKWFFEATIESCKKILHTATDIEGRDFALETLSNYTYSLVFDEVCRVVDRTDGSHIFHVINHGDTWTNNMLFRRNPERAELDRHVFCDFQLCRFGSPNLDVSYFLYTSLKPEVRKQNLEALKLYYFTCLKHFVNDLGHSFEVAFEDFDKDYKLRRPIGIWIQMFSLFANVVLDGVEVEGMECDFSELLTERTEKFVFENPDKAHHIGFQSVALLRELLE